MGVFRGANFCLIKIIENKKYLRLMHDPVFFDDLSVGDIFDSISKTITETEIIEFDGSMIRNHFT